VTPGREAELTRRLKEAEAQAALGGQPKWSFPPKPTVYPKVPLLDLDVRNGGEFLPNRARSDIESGLARVKGVRLAQAEVFIAKERQQVVTSTGSAAGDDTSRLSLTIVLLAGRARRSRSGFHADPAAPD
jgi:predicted Zn-dependent protease